MQVLYITILTIFASSIGTITGFGLSTVMIPVLLIFFPYPQTLLLVCIIHWFNDIWKIILFREGIRWKLLLTFGLVGVVTTFFGASLTFVASRIFLSRALALFLVCYVIFLSFKSSLRIPSSTVAASGGGALSGFLAGIFGMGGAVRSMCLSAFDLPKAVYMSTAGAVALIIDSTRFVTYVGGGTRIEAVFLWGLIIFIPASFIGAKIGKKIVDRIPQKYFRAVVAAFLLLVGLKLLIFPG